jgi:hypothetical protein
MLRRPPEQPTKERSIGLLPRVPRSLTQSALTEMANILRPHLRSDLRSNQVAPSDRNLVRPGSDHQTPGLETPALGEDGDWPQNDLFRVSSGTLLCCLRVFRLERLCHHLSTGFLG